MTMTRIVCTIGPSSNSPEIIRELVDAGMSVARLNFSHGNHQSHQESIRTIRDISQARNRPVAILQDLGGPKIRVGLIPDPGIRLEPGQSFVLTGDPVQGSRERVSVSYADLPHEVRPGDRLLLSDGFMEVVVREIREKDIHCEVIIGGILTSRKGINLPDGTIETPSLTDKDLSDLGFGLENDVDYVALSFVRSAEDILNAKSFIAARGKDIPIIAKIEKHEAIQHIDDIIERSDGLMVARGDLGVEIPLERVPGIQKMIIKKANLAGKPVITATQMLRSMVDSPRPTRAEAADVANAVMDGTDAVMLSEETASGSYPVEAVRFMARIVKSAEAHFPHGRFLEMIPRQTVPETVAHASCVLAEHLGAAAILAPTRSGRTAWHISHYRPGRVVIALCPDPSTIRRLALCWGCVPRFMAAGHDTDEMIDDAARTALDTGRVSEGDLVVITSGHPVWVAGTTNMVRVKRL
ncbi:MAG: pyruvate kinase [Desulfatiglandales bacterium]